ncbi:hypothetical protein COF61_21900 [Bacillus toyonensis]|nr:hypothetical protein COF61_21900 [Bacillus toyonensis]
MNHLYFPFGEDGSPIHIIKIKVVQFVGWHLRVSFLYALKAHLFRRWATCDFALVHKKLLHVIAKQLFHQI